MTERTVRLAGRLARWRVVSQGERGQGLAEYSLILAFVALAAVTALGLLGDAIANSPGFDLFP